MATNPQKFTALPQVFDSSTVAPAQPMEAIPSGWYNVTITDGEIKPTGNGSGIRMELEWTVLDGDFKGRKIFDGLNIQNASAKAQEISQQQLSAICHATNTIRLQDVQELFNKPHQIKVDQEPGRWVDSENTTIDPQPLPGQPGPQGTKYYEAKNRFKGAKAGVGVVTPAVATAAPAPSWQAAPKPAVAAAPVPAALPGAVTPPWIKPGAAAPAPAPVAPIPATPAPAPAAAAPKGPKGPKAKAAAEKKYHVFMPDGTVSDPKPASEIAQMLGQGMPLDTMLNIEGGGDDDWKPAGEFGFGAAPAAAPAAATPAGAPVQPPWMQQRP